jgi:hypothetical protein
MILIYRKKKNNVTIPKVVREEYSMNEKPILFNTEMVKAILEGRKTSTRRPVKRTPSNDDPSGYGFWKDYNERDSRWYIKDYTHSPLLYTLEEYINKWSKYHIGDILYVRETFANTWTPDGEEGFAYKADGEPSKFPYWGNANQCKDEVWIPSIHMPRVAARIFLKVTDVRIERIRATTAGDCKKEGVKLDFDITDIFTADEYIEGFKKIWDSIYQKQGDGWDENPWTWVFEFEKLDNYKVQGVVTE